MYQFESRVRYSEVDSERHLTLPAVMDYLQDCCTFQSEDMNIGVEYLAEQKQAWVLSSWEIKIRRYPVMGEKICVETWPYAFKGFYGYRNFRIANGQGEELVLANSDVYKRQVLNTIVAEAFAEACDVLEKADDFDMAVHDLIKEYATEHQRIVFNGNGYSDEWVAEAEKRGLPNIRSMVDAIPALNTEKAVTLFEKFRVFTKAELDSRVEIEYETYAKEINIEAKAMIDIAAKQIIPAVIKYTTVLAQSINAVKSACGADISAQTEILTEVSDLLADAQNALDKLKDVTEKASAMDEGREQAVYYRDTVKKAMDELRAPVDKLEMLVDKSMWPMPSYGDLIFEV